MRESKTKAKLRRLSSTRAVWSASYSRGVNSPGPRLLLPRPSPVPRSSETPNFRFVADLAKWTVSRSPESQPSRTRDAAGCIGRPAGHSGRVRPLQESAERAGGQPGGGILGGAGSDARTTEKPGASSGSPLGPPCDFETGGPDRSLGDGDAACVITRGRQRLRHRASWRSLTLLAVCPATGGAVGTWMTAGWGTCVAADALVGLCLRRVGVTKLFFSFYSFKKERNVNIGRLLNTYFKCSSIFVTGHFWSGRTRSPKADGWKVLGLAPGSETQPGAFSVYLQSCAAGEFLGVNLVISRK